MNMVNIRFTYLKMCAINDPAISKRMQRRGPGDPVAHTVELADGFLDSSLVQEPGTTLGPANSLSHGDAAEEWGLGMVK